MRLSRVYLACSSMVLSSLPSLSRIPACPEVKMRSPARTAEEKGQERVPGNVMTSLVTYIVS